MPLHHLDTARPLKPPIQLGLDRVGKENADENLGQRPQSSRHGDYSMEAQKPQRGASPNQQARQSYTDAALRRSLIENETVIAEYKTLAECTFGLPRYEIIFTNKRIIYRERLRFLGLYGKAAETSIDYGDVVHVSIGQASHRESFLAATILAALGLLAFIVLAAAGHAAAGAGLLVTGLVMAVALVLGHYIVEHFIEGVVLGIDVCKTNRLVASWHAHGSNHSAQVYAIRLPMDQAYAAMRLFFSVASGGARPKMTLE